MSLKNFSNFVKTESFGSVFLLIATCAALLIANSAWQTSYFTVLTHPLQIAIFNHFIEISLSRFINDGLMALFFLVVTLEIKQELIEGELNTGAKAALPAIAALGGMLLPALIYTLINIKNSSSLHGWAIPTATDIAFSLAILRLIGQCLPKSVRIFLTALAIIDDLGAIAIIALFYTQPNGLLYLLLVALCVLLLIILNRAGQTKLRFYFILALFLGFFLHNAHIHSTITGVILGFVIPLSNKEKTFSPLKILENRLNPWVAFVIMPLFAFANTGLNFSQFALTHLIHPITVGIALGLFLGKQLGIFSASLLAIKCKIAHLPQEMTWHHLYGVSILCGIGFTMSLFIGDLAFSDKTFLITNLVKMGVLSGSLFSAILGLIFLKLTCNRSANKNNASA